MGVGGDENPYEASHEDQEQHRRNAKAPEATGYARPASTLPVGQLDAMSPFERRRATRKRGLDWPTTDEARDRLFERIAEVMQHGDDRVVDVPTALGKRIVAFGSLYSRTGRTSPSGVCHRFQTLL
jgi:hypothetical protein